MPLHYFNFSGERMLPSIPALLDQPFWLDPSDRHHVAAAMQAESRRLLHDYTAAAGDLGHDQICNERVWREAVHRIIIEDISAEQAVDEAITRIKEILSEYRNEDEAISAAIALLACHLIPRPSSQQTRATSVGKVVMYILGHPRHLRDPARRTARSDARAIGI